MNPKPSLPNLLCIVHLPVVAVWNFTDMKNGGVEFRQKTGNLKNAE